MSKLLIKLNGAPEDEVAELRQLLDENAIDFYETDAGRWGISVAGLWLRDDHQLQAARDLVDAYQQARSARIRAEYEALRRDGKHETLFTRFISEPWKILLYLLLIMVVLYLTLSPFITAL